MMPTHNGFAVEVQNLEVELPPYFLALHLVNLVEEIEQPASEHGNWGSTSAAPLVSDDLCRPLFD